MLSISNALHKQLISKPSFDKPSARSTKVQQSSASTMSHGDNISTGHSITHESGMTLDEHTQSKERFKWLHNAAMVEHGTLLIDNPVETNSHHMQQKLMVLAEDQYEFNQLMYSAFGDGIDANKLEALREQVLAQDFSWMPQVTYVDSETLQGADGAYAANTNTIYLNSDAANQGLDSLVYAEELGHSIDRIINAADTGGDEGALFASNLLGVPLSDADRALLKAENDTGTITVNGEVVDVEFSMLSAELRRLSDNVKDWVRKAQEFFQRTEAAIKGMVEDLSEIVTTVLSRPFNVLREFGGGLERVFELVLDGKFGQAGTEIRDMLVNTGKVAISILPEVVAMTLNAVVMAVDRARGAVNERPLKIEEVRYLQNIFGNNIDLSRVVIVSGGTKDQWGMRAHVVGNEIFMPNTLNDGAPMFQADGSLTAGGLALLGHEAAHVWQYQHFGTEYIGDSLMAQLYDGENDTYDWYHEVSAGTAFEDMNSEQQAGIAELIGQAVQLNIENGEYPRLTLVALNAVIAQPNLVITEEQFDIFLAASLILNPDVNNPKKYKPPMLPRPLREVERQMVSPGI